MTPGDSGLFAPFLEQQGVVILDGGLATALEARGHVLETDLWNARLLVDDPEEIGAVHRAFLDAGADCISTASYQASHAGYAPLGYGEQEVDGLLLRSVSLAAEAVEAFWSEPANRAGRIRPLVAASVGPYGAYLADGSEYDGRYGVGDEVLRAFHQRRFELFANSGADLIACETIPSLSEGAVLCRLFDETPSAVGWISFSCRDGGHLWDGTPIETAVDHCTRGRGVVGVGVNCTAPQHVAELIDRMRRRTDLPVVIYPNSGEGWNSEDHSWTGSSTTEPWGDAAAGWVSSGATCVGGCCRVGPDAIAAVRSRVVVPSN
jgi:homocysteine S-methyltransferase